MSDASMPEVKAEEVDAPDDCGHRVLIFAQLKSYLDIVESDVLTPAGVSYLRLDGRYIIDWSCIIRRPRIVMFSSSLPDTIWTHRWPACTREIR